MPRCRLGHRAGAAPSPLDVSSAGAGERCWAVTQLGYTLSSEEFDAPTLVAQAERAERAGFGFDFYEREVLPSFR